MSLALRLKSLVEAVGADIKQLFQNYTNLANNKVVYLPMLKITITEPTTSVAVAYTPGMIKVHQAGILLREGDDFTATTGVTLQFNYTLLAGDEIDIERISVENAPGMIAQEQTDWNATSGITSIANKPDFIAAGSTAAAARNVIDVSSRDQALPEYYLVDAIGAYTAGGTVTLGDQIPGASTGVVWAVGKIIGVTSGGETGAVLSVIAGGTLSSVATSTAKNTASNGGGGSVFARFFRYKYGNTYLYLRTSGGGYLYGDLGSSQTTELWHVLSGGSKVSLNDYLGTVGEVANLTTTDKTSLVAAINEARLGLPVDFWSVQNARNTAITNSVTIGAAIPGAPSGTVFNSGMYLLHQASGNIYIIGADGTVTLHSAMPDNAERVVNVNYGISAPIALASGIRTFRKIGGILTVQNFNNLNSSAVIHVDNTTYIGQTLQTVIGRLGDLTTTNKSSLVDAINEVKAAGGGGGGSGIAVDYVNATIARSSGLTTVVTIGAAIPGSTTGAVFADGQFVLDQTNGDIYVIGSDGTITLSSAMPDNTQRIVAVAYGDGATSSLHAGLRYYRKVSGTTTSIVSTAMNSDTVYHLNTTTNVASPLSSVIGQLPSLTTTAKNSLVDSINEVKAATATKTLNSKSIAGTGNIDIALRNTSNYAAFDTTAKSVTIGLDSLKTTATFTTGQSVVRSDKGVTLGTAGLKLYFEITFVSGTASGNSSIGVTGASPVLTSQLGYDGLTVGEIAVFQNSGDVYANAVTSSVGSGTSFSAAGSVVGVAVDITNKKIWFRTNNGIWNNNAANNPQTGVGGFDISGTGLIYPAVCTDTSAVFKLNAGATAFAFTPPTGFSEWFTSVIVDTIVPTDVEITSPAADEVLSYNGSKWVNTKRQITVSTTAPTSPTLNQLWLDIS